MTELTPKQTQVKNDALDALGGSDKEMQDFLDEKARNDAAWEAEVARVAEANKPTKRKILDAVEFNNTNTGIIILLQLVIIGLIIWKF